MKMRQNIYQKRKLYIIISKVRTLCAIHDRFVLEANKITTQTNNFYKKWFFLFTGLGGRSSNRPYRDNPKLKKLQLFLKNTQCIDWFTSLPVLKGSGLLNKILGVPG